MRLSPLLLCAFLTLPAWCDEGVEDLINQAIEAYREGRKQEAADLLQKAAGLIQKEGERGFASFLPPAGDGWERGEVDSQSGTWGSGGQTYQWTQVSADYTKGDARVEISISSSPQLIEAQKAMAEMVKDEGYRAAMMADGEQKIDLFTRDGWSGWTQVEKDGNATRWAISEKLMIQIEVSGGDEATLNRFSDQLDWAGLAASAR